MTSEKKHCALKNLARLVKAAKRAHRQGKNVAFDAIISKAEKLSDKLEHVVEEELNLLAPLAPTQELENADYRHVDGEIIYEIVDEFEESMNDAFRIRPNIKPEQHNLAIIAAKQSL